MFTLSFLSSSMDPMMSHKSLLKIQKKSKHYFDYAIKNVPSQKIVHSGRFCQGSSVVLSLVILSISPVLLNILFLFLDKRLTNNRQTADKWLTDEDYKVVTTDLTDFHHFISRSADKKYRKKIYVDWHTSYFKGNQFLNIAFNNILAISWLSFLLVEELEGTEKNPYLHWKTLSHKDCI